MTAFKGLCLAALIAAGPASPAIAADFQPLPATVAQTSAATPGTPSRTITLDLSRADGPIDRFFDLSVGSDYPGTLRRPENMAQLKTMVEETGFRYLRFHAIFHDVLETVRVEDGQITYDWTGIDQLYDALLAIGIRPFVELSFTPEAMATSPQTVFYWKGNTSHPDPAAWHALVDAFVRHIEERYGAPEVRRWYFEIWNEPNLDGFWENADQEAYFALYDDTAATIKAIDPALRVGGPATAGAGWIPAFLGHIRQSGAPIDFVSTHSYGVDGGFLDVNGEADPRLSPSPDAIIGDVRMVRRHIEAGPHPGQPLFFSEWSASYTPRDPVHDSYISAPYILTKLKASRGLIEAMSYWCYSDLFEESGPPPTPFHGGFGLMSRDGLRKPAYFAYKYLHALQGHELPTADGQTWAATDGKAINAVIWDWQQPIQDVGDRTFYAKPLVAPPAPTAHVRLTHLRPGGYRLRLYRTGYHANDVFTAYQEMGSPDTLDPQQLASLQEQSRDLPEQDRIVQVGIDGTATLDLPMRINDIVLLSLTPEPRSLKNLIKALVTGLPAPYRSATDWIKSQRLP